MKTYVEEIEELGAHGITFLSLVRGMSFFYAEVRASGITILTDTDGTEMDKEHELLPELTEAVNKYLKEN